jgi:hypothetical protein
MGTWGKGTWENDTALSFLGATISSLKKAIEQDLTSAQTDDVLERPTLAAVAILRILLANVGRTYFLSRKQVASWREQYLAWLDANSRDFDATDRSNAEREFQLLLDQAGDEESE